MRISVYRVEVEDLVCWCRDINLILNIHETKEMVVDFYRTGTYTFHSTLSEQW